MKNEITMKATLVLTNRKAISALAFVAGVLEDAQESQPWNEDFKKAMKALDYAAKRLRVRLWK